MQLDQATIAIHERSWADNLDLALHVIRKYAAAIALCALAGILPWALLNHGLAAGVLFDEFQDPSATGASWLLLVLVMIETPLAAAPITLYLGQALFVERPQPRTIARDFVACLPQVVLLQILPRLVLIPLVVTWFIPYGIYPYLGEVILLERNPLSTQPGQLSTLKRNALLHQGAGGWFMLQALLALCLAGLLAAAIYLTEDFLLENLFGIEADWAMELVETQIALWLVAIFFTAARFLCYLDQRIRREGWEVELFLRAERQRIMRHVA